MKIGAALAMMMVIATPALADGDAAKGENVFKKCRACHEVGENAKTKVGPVLNGVIGRVAGTAEGFPRYSDAMKEAGANGLVWDEESIEGYLADPKNFIPKNNMAFAGLKKEDDVEDVIAYLKQFSK